MIGLSDFFLDTVHKLGANDQIVDFIQFANTGRTGDVNYSKLLGYDIDAGK